MAKSKETSLAPLNGALPGSGPKEPYDPAVADETVRFPALLNDPSFWRLARSVGVFTVSLWRLRDKPRAQVELAEAALVKNLLIELGPTYIKLGQFLSVRRDLLPVKVADELTTLQDRVPPFELAVARQIIQSELGAPVEELFADFQEKPLASASIGQVHRVTLKDGRDAVVKIQRPGLAKDFYRDLGLLRLAANSGLALDSFWRKVQGKNGNGRPARFDFRNWLEMSDEFGRTLFAEIDYLVEGRNADRLRKCLRDRPEVRIPRVIWKHSGRRVLTLEFIETIKIDRSDELIARGIDLGALGNILISCYLEQLVIQGFFHADPHAGNLGADPSGKLVIFDFGMMGEITDSQRRALFRCVVSTINRDSDTLVRSLAELGVVRSGTNHEAVGRAIAPFMDYYAGQSIFDLDFKQLEHDIDTVISERSLRLPANLAYLLRTGSSVEGIARTLKSDFSFIAAVKPVVKKLLLQEGIESLSTLAGLMHLAGQAVSTLRRTGELDKPAAQIRGAILAEAQQTCPTCQDNRESSRKNKENLRQIKSQLSQLTLFSLGYFVISLGTIVLQEFRHAPGNTIFSPRDASLYFLIGNIIVGGIMIGKIIRLQKWTAESPRDKSSSNNKKTTGERK